MLNRLFFRRVWYKIILLQGQRHNVKNSTYFLGLLFFLEKTVHVTCEMNDNSACDEFSVNDYYARNKVMSVMYLFFSPDIVPILKIYYAFM